jgi:hypothetical protein
LHGSLFRVEVAGEHLHDGTVLGVIHGHWEPKGGGSIPAEEWVLDRLDQLDVQEEAD